MLIIGLLNGPGAQHEIVMKVSKTKQIANYEIKGRRCARSMAHWDPMGSESAQGHVRCSSSHPK